MVLVHTEFISPLLLPEIKIRFSIWYRKEYSGRRGGVRLIFCGVRLISDAGYQGMLVDKLQRLPVEDFRFLYINHVPAVLNDP